MVFKSILHILDPKSGPNRWQRTDGRTHGRKDIFENIFIRFLEIFSEDFSILSAAKPGCFVLMGNGTSGSHSKSLHASNYDFNDELLVIGSSYWTELAEQQLK